MKYKSSYKTAILLQQKLLAEKQREIAVFQLEKRELEKKLADYQQKENDFYQMLVDEIELDSRMLKSRIDKNGKNAILYMISLADQKISELNQQYLLIQNRMNAIKEMDKEKEKQFHKENMKKESKKIESVMLIKRWKEDKENG